VAVKNEPSHWHNKWRRFLCRLAILAEPSHSNAATRRDTAITRCRAIQFVIAKAASRHRRVATPTIGDWKSISVCPSHRQRSLPAWLCWPSAYEELDSKILIDAIAVHATEDETVQTQIHTPRRTCSSSHFPNGSTGSISPTQEFFVGAPPRFVGSSSAVMMRPNNQGERGEQRCDHCDVDRCNIERAGHRYSDATGGHRPP